MVPSYDPEPNLVHVETSVTSPAPKFMIGGTGNKHLNHSSTLALDADRARFAITGRGAGAGAEETEHRREVIEAALAHVVDNKVEAAYARSNLFERRRRLMDDWSAYLNTTSAGDPAPALSGRHGGGVCVRGGGIRSGDGTESRDAASAAGVSARAAG